MKRKKILWVSLCTPYLEIPHAGGQTLCHYYKEFANADCFDINFISFYNKGEKVKVENSLMCKKEDIDLLLEADSIFSRILDIENRVNPWNRFGGYLSNSREILLRRALQRYKDQIGVPEYIILQWTEVVIYIERIKKMFPQSKIIVIEEDIAFLKRERRYLSATNPILRLFHKLRFKHSKKRELAALNQSDLVVVNNEKDQKLVLDNGVDSKKIYLSCAYFKPMGDIGYKRKNKDILFWGAMARKENSESAMWFIRNVMPVLEGEGFRFVIIGSNPPQELLEKSNDHIVVTGFVDDPISFFRESFCLAAPLVNGAGIKVKILEALSAGIPVITNSIGIEGIPAENEVNYFHAETPGDYINYIHKLSNMNDEEVNEFSNREQELIHSTFDFEGKLTTLITKISKM